MAKKKTSVESSKGLTELQRQVKLLSPSISVSLFVRLQSDERMLFLHKDKGVVGFEVDLKQSKSLNGFTLLGIDKQLFYVYVPLTNDRLVLFPTVEVAKDERYDLDGLMVREALFMGNDFKGKYKVKKPFSEAIVDYLPPYDSAKTSFDFVDTVTDKETPVVQPEMSVVQSTAQEDVSDFSKAVVVDEPKVVDDEVIVDDIPEDYADYEDALMDEYGDSLGDVYEDYEPDFDEGFDGAEGFGEALSIEPLTMLEPVVTEPVVTKKTRYDVFLEQDFDSFESLKEYMWMTLKIPKMTSDVLMTSLFNTAVKNYSLQTKSNDMPSSKVIADTVFEYLKQTLKDPTSASRLGFVNEEVGG